MIGSIIANDHAEARRPCMLRTTGSFAALFAPYTEQVATHAKSPASQGFTPALEAPQARPRDRSDAISDRLSEDIEGADAPAGTET